MGLYKTMEIKYTTFTVGGSRPCGKAAALENSCSNLSTCPGGLPYKNDGGARRTF